MLSFDQIVISHSTLRKFLEAPALLEKVEIKQNHEDFTEYVLVHSVRGQSGFFDLVLTERNVLDKFNLMLSVYSLGLEI